MKYKKSEEEVDVCKALQEMQMEARKEGERIGEQKGELKKAKEMVKNLYKLKVELETIAQGVGYPIETVKEWLGLA